MTQSKANLIAVSSAANIDILSVNLTLRSTFNFGTQIAAEVLSAKVLDASVYSCLFFPMLSLSSTNTVVKFKKK